jgi:hypothetical protein
LLSDQKKYEQAEEMHRQALGLKGTVLRKEHPSTLTSVNSLANLLSTRHQFEQVSILYQRALLGYRLKLGPAHPIAIACERYYSSMLHEMELGSQGKG